MASSSSSVDQPTDKSKIIHLRIGSFNVGMDQELLESDKSRESFQTLQPILETCFDDVALDIMNLCGVGGSKKGIGAAGISVHDLKMFRQIDGPNVDVNNNYFTIWHSDETPGKCRLNIVKDASSHTLQSDFCEPEIVIHTFGDDTTNLRLYQGNFIIPLSTGASVWSVGLTAREQLLCDALVKLDEEAANDTAPQRVVKLLLGTFHLTDWQAEAVIQRLQPDNANADNVWQVHHCEQTTQGDLIFVKGAHAMRVISWSLFCLWCPIHITDCHQNICAYVCQGYRSHLLSRSRPLALIYQLVVVIATWASKS